MENSFNVVIYRRYRAKESKVPRALYKIFYICYTADKWVGSPKGGNHSMSAQSPVLRGFELLRASSKILLKAEFLRKPYPAFMAEFVVCQIFLFLLK